MAQNYVTYAETQHTAECVLFELPNGYCRGDFTVDAAAASVVSGDVSFVSAAITDGTILGAETAGGDVAPVNEAGTDGTQTVVGVSITTFGPGPFLPSSTVTAIVRGPARLAKNRIRLPAGATEAQAASLYSAIENLPGGIQLI